MQSESIAELATALSKAQASLSVAKKDADNPYHKSKYADLTSVWEACRSALTTNDLSVTQTMAPYNDGVCIVTTLMHKSGQWLRSELPLKAKDPTNPQAIGSLITYGRRYSLAAIVGIVQDDDDAETARNAQAKQNNNQQKQNYQRNNQQRQAPPQQRQPAQQSQTPPPAQQTVQDADMRELKEAKIRLTQLVLKNNIDAEQLEIISGVPSIKDIGVAFIADDAYAKVIEHLGNTQLGETA